MHATEGRLFEQLVRGHTESSGEIEQPGHARDFVATLELAQEMAANPQDAGQFDSGHAALSPEAAQVLGDVGCFVGHFRVWAKHRGFEQWGQMRRVDF